MLPDHVELLDRERRRLPQHRVGHRELADVVQQGAAFERLHVVGRGASQTRHAGRGGHAIGMGVGITIRRVSTDSSPSSASSESMVSAVSASHRRSRSWTSSSSVSRHRRESRAALCHSRPRRTDSRRRSRPNGLVR